MPNEYSKQSLGQLFGGQIASLNFNFQTSSEPSSATLTIVNENNQFATPNLNEEVNIPPFSLPMKVVESTKRETPKKKILQVELIERASEVLDKELVLIYGEHTDLNYKLNNDLFYIIKGLFVPKGNYPRQTTFNPSIQFPNLNKDFLKYYGDGVNVIGTSRASYSRRFPARLTGLEDGKPITESQWITFDGGGINKPLSNYDGEFVYGGNESGDLDLKFGYTLKNLYDLILTKGLSFSDSSVAIMQDRSFFFEESGTIREVLSSCLSKIGRSFYIDPITQKIVIISNREISEINTKLLLEFNNFQDTDAATQLSLTQSIKDVEANHFVLKGDLNNFAGKNERSPSYPRAPRARKQKFYKLKETFLTNLLNSSDIALMRIIAPLLFVLKDNEALDSLIYGLFRLDDKYSGGTLYNKEDCDFKPFEERVKINRNQTVDISYPDWQEPWLDVEDDSDFKFNGFFNIKNAVGGNQQFSGGDEENPLPVVSPSSKQFHERTRDFLDLWGGTYFSVSMSEKEASERNYIPQAKFVGGQLNTFQYYVAEGSDLIVQTEPLQFLYSLLKWAREVSGQDIRTDYTVKEIADFSAKEAVGTGDYYIIAKRSLFQGSELDSEDIQKDLRSNLLSFVNVKTNESFLVQTKDSASKVQAIVRDSEKSFKKEEKKVKDELIVKFIKTDDDSPNGDNEDASNAGGGEEPTNPIFLRNIQSRIRNFSKRTLSFITSPISEMKVFLENINEINPQFEGPFISTKINYYRPPQISDFDLKKGVSSVSVSISDNGVETNVDYSSRKFAKIDQTFINEHLGTTSLGLQKKQSFKAFQKNRQGS